MMSSEGSVSSGGSRIRQFGLYRSIDARTEEFLRLSRRRQIRQGCACAAVSTAITVTVVVVVIFVYEFSLNSKVNIESSLKRNWFSLINDTTENGFETKYAKAGIDKTTLTMLPILLKALKKNVLLEKILEEQSSSIPIYEAEQTTESSSDKNMLTRSWFRFPSSKFYAIAYKTSPIAYYKSPSKNMEYFTKIRKIRDYQRVINYVDKMISERVYLPTKPMMKGEMFTEKSLIKSVTKGKQKPDSVTQKLNIQVPKNGDTKTEDKIINCKCPTRLGEILNKILSGIEKLLSIDPNTENKTMTGCHHENYLKQPNTILNTKSSNCKTNENNQATNIIGRKINENVDKNTQLKSTSDEEKNTTPEFWQQEHLKDYKDYESSTSVPIDHLDATDTVPQFLTKPMLSMNKYTNTLEPSKSVLNFFHRNNKIMLKKIPETTSNEINNEEQNEETTTRDYLEVLNTKSLKNNPENAEQTEHLIDPLEYAKVKSFSPITFERPQSVLVNSLPKNKLNINLNKAIYKLVLKDNNIQIKPKPTKTVTPLFKTSSITTQTTGHVTEPNIVFKKSKVNHRLSSVPPPTSYKLPLYYTTHPVQSSSSPTHLMQDIKSKDAITTKLNLLSPVDDEIENLNNLTQEDLNKQIESVTDDPMRKNVSIINKTEVLWEELKNEKIPAWKSMMPNHRPVYLEIHPRNDWKHDDQDYDFNIITNYDTIPDVA